MTDRSRDASADEITPGLFVGNMACVESESALQQLGITAVVSVVSKYRKPFPQPSTPFGRKGRRPHPLEKLYDVKDRFVIFVDDTRWDNIFRHFEGACEFIDYQLRQVSGRNQAGLNTMAFDDGRGSGRVLVHCTLGISRSATIVAAYMMWKWRFRASRALQYIKKQRSATSPNGGFIDQLLVWEELRCNPWLSRWFHIWPQAYYEMTSRLENYKRIREVKDALDEAREDNNTRASHRTNGSRRVHSMRGNTFRYCTRAKR